MEGVELERHAFSLGTIWRWSASRPVRFNRRGRAFPPYPFNRGLGWLRGQSGRFGDELPSHDRIRTPDRVARSLT